MKSDIDAWKRSSAMWNQPLSKTPTALPWAICCICPAPNQSHRVIRPPAVSLQSSSARPEQPPAPPRPVLPCTDTSTPAPMAGSENRIGEKLRLGWRPKQTSSPARHRTARRRWQDACRCRVQSASDPAWRWCRTTSVRVRDQIELKVRLDLKRRPAQVPCSDFQGYVEVDLSTGTVGTQSVKRQPLAHPERTPNRDEELAACR